MRVGSSASARLLVFLSEQRFKGGRRNTSTIVEPDGDAPAGGVNWGEPIPCMQFVEITSFHASRYRMLT